MDLLKIKNLVKQNGDKFIFVENGEPELVVMSFGEYEKLANGGQQEKVHAGSGRGVFTGEEGRGIGADTDFLSHNFPETKVEVASDYGAAGLPIRLEDIRLEDLPI